MNLCQAHNRSVKIAAAAQNPLALLCHFDGSLDDASGNHCSYVLNNGNPSEAHFSYTTASKFGSHALTATIPSPSADTASRCTYTLPAADFSKAWTVDWWWKPTSGASAQVRLTDMLGLQINTVSKSVAVFQFTPGTSSPTSTWSVDYRQNAILSALNVNSFSHWAITRDEQNTVRCFFGGQCFHSFEYSTPDRQVPSAFVWLYTALTTVSVVDEFRVLPGVCAWDSDFTPPTAAYSGFESF